jgi:hypothetical protein
MSPKPNDPEKSLINRMNDAIDANKASAQTSGPAYVAALATELTESFGIAEAESIELAATVFPRLGHAEDGGLVVSLPTGLRTRADAPSVKVYAAHLARLVRKRSLAEDHEARVAAKRASGVYPRSF